MIDDIDNAEAVTGLLRASEGYNADAIKILSAHEASERFAFAQVERLIEQYPVSAAAFVKRLVEACTLSGWPVALAEARYLAKVPDAEKPPTEFVEVFRELADQRK